ncbi:MAG TPA: glycosyltransferase [Ilumatobacteraceae bacterium]
MTPVVGGGIHQTLVTAAPGDAVTNSALQIRHLLQTIGPSEIFARNIHHDLVDVVLPLDSYHSHLPHRARDTLTIVHLSMGDPDWFSWVLDLSGDIAVSYHNMTPHEYFEGWDPKTATLLHFGRSTLAALGERSILTMADSAFNASELETLGFRNSHVAGLLLDPSLLVSVRPDKAVLDAALTRRGPTLLHVGQMYPHKRADFLIASFRRLLSTHGDTTLVLAGNSRLPAYRQAIHDYIGDLGLSDHVVVTGSISVESLSAHYRTADVMVTASEHEGFCVPLVEAMAFGVPIVARACAAVPETTGGCGVLVPPDASPSQFAFAVGSVLDDLATADAMRACGHRRVEHFSLDNSSARLLHALATVR